MNMYKDKGLIYGEYILNMVTYYMDCSEVEGKVETFYNCREQGYVLRLHDKDYKKNLCVWICANRHSDEPMIVYDYIPCPTEGGNMYGEEAYEERNTTYDNLEDAVKSLKDLIKNYFEL